MFEVRTRVRDGETIHQLRCPGCGVWADLDDDQLHGRVSVDHTDTGCTFHETHDFAAALPVPAVPEETLATERDPVCVAAWPDCASGTYDPRCCRFPKSCSCTRPVPAVPEEKS